MKGLRACLTALLCCGLLALSPGTPMRDFTGAAAWLNVPSPLTPAGLRGKVVLVDFWEYSCINCLRTLPYLREWYKRYRDGGFVIVGVHTPEFGFTGQQKNVEAAAQRLDVTWPVALDDDYAIWKRYGVNEWPTELLFDQNGELVETSVGEGGYQQTEAAIQQLLKKNDPHLTLPPVMALLPQDNYLKPGAVCYPQTPEILVENRPVADANNFGDPSQDLNYNDRSATRTDGAIYLEGYWHATKQALVFGGGPGYIALPYHAIQVNVVMVPSGGPARVRVTEDGKPVPHEDAGPDLHYDTDGTSYVTVDAPRAYDILVNQKFGERELRLYPDRAGVGFYDFAFESCEVPKST
jgi:thiol-disulfide isomerase/thioredoxin